MDPLGPHDMFSLIRPWRSLAEYDPRRPNQVEHATTDSRICLPRDKGEDDVLRETRRDTDDDDTDVAPVGFRGGQTAVGLCRVTRQYESYSVLVVLVYCTQ